MEKKDLLEKANIAYREGTPIMSDDEFDNIADEVGYSAVGFKPTNKSKLPTRMGSLDKVKTHDEFAKWVNKEDHKSSRNFYITPKYDGLAMLIEFKNGVFYKAYTRGDGEEGTDVTKHFNKHKINKITLPSNMQYLVGEIICDNKTFQEKYSKEFKNPRNMVAGIMNRKDAEDDIVKEFSFQCYQVKGMSLKEGLEAANLYVNDTKVEFDHVFRGMDLVCFDSFLATIKKENVFDYDGVVIYDMDYDSSEEHSGNPEWAIAYKPQGLSVSQTVVTGIKWSVSKQGYLKPVVEIVPVETGGVTISNVTGYNARYIKDNQIAAGAVVGIIRSGDVIPKIVEIVRGKVAAELDKCPCCSSEINWNDNGVELVCSNEVCGDRNVMGITFYLRTLKLDGVSEGTVQQLIDNGYDTLEKIYKLDTNVLSSLEGWGMTKSDKFKEELTEKSIGVTLEKLQHATGLFKGLGERKLVKLSDYDSPAKIPTYDQILKVEGFSDTSAVEYLLGIEKFWKWYDTHKTFVGIKKANIIKASDTLLNKSFCFTGFRNAEYEATLKQNGAEIAGGVNKKTFMLVTGGDSSSSKYVKAKELGIQILNKDQFTVWMHDNGFTKLSIEVPKSGAISELDDL